MKSSSACAFASCSCGSLSSISTFRALSPFSISILLVSLSFAFSTASAFRVRFACSNCNFWLASSSLLSSSLSLAAYFGSWISFFLVSSTRLFNSVKVSVISDICLSEFCFITCWFCCSFSFSRSFWFHCIFIWLFPCYSLGVFVDGGKSDVSKVRLKLVSGCCFVIVFVIFVLANSFPRSTTLRSTYPLFLDAIFRDVYNLLLVIGSVPGARYLRLPLNKIIHCQLPVGYE